MLNDKQKEAVSTTEGPLLILAGAGAGKTKTIAERIRHLLHKGVAPSKVLAITFTNKASKEMRERINLLLEEDKSLNKPISMNERPFVSTFHSLGVHIIKEQSAKLGLSRHFTIFDRDDSKKAVKEALEKCGLDVKTHDPNRVLSIISKEKGRGMTLEDYEGRGERGHFSDVVEMVVGDIDQNIYSWRGADIKNILDFEKDYPEAKIILLEENYRSTKTILDAANIIIEKNKIRRKKNLFTLQDGGEKIGIFQGFDESAEAEFIASRVEKMIDEGREPKTIAVLYRANFQSRVLEEAFMGHRIPYQLLGTRFFERKEIKDILSYLRASLNKDSLGDIKRIINVPARGIGKSTVAKIFSGLESDISGATQKKIKDFYGLLEKIKNCVGEKNPSEIIQFIIRETGLESEWKENKGEDLDRLENAYELVAFAKRYDGLPRSEGVENLLVDSALNSDQDELKEDKNAVRLMTVHASKGLEFDVVFIAGLEDGLFPHQKITKDNITPEEAEEERRLFYVALTRAKKKIFLSYAQIRTIFGSRQVNIPSEFVFDIPEELTEEETFEGEDSWRGKPLLDISFD
jgi:superfamily I DNA/RNA helicase